MEDTIKRIYEKLTSENAEWVKQVFSATGVLCEYNDDGYIRLMSLCGDESLPYDWPDDELSNVDSIDSFIEYIKNLCYDDVTRDYILNNRDTYIFLILIKHLFHIIKIIQQILNQQYCVLLNMSLIH